MMARRIDLGNRISSEGESKVWVSRFAFFISRTLQRRPLSSSTSKEILTVEYDLLNRVYLIIGQTLIDSCCEFKKIVETLFRRSFYLKPNVLTF